MIAAFDYSILATVDAILNLTAFLLIIAGLVAIKRGNESLHKALMLAATAVSAAFLVCYLIYHFNAEAVKYTGEWGVVYYPMLISHIALAAVQVPLILMTLLAAFRDDRARHRRLAKITAPIWLYVSLTGVLIYVALYLV